MWSVLGNRISGRRGDPPGVGTSKQGWSAYVGLDGGSKNRHVRAVNLLTNFYFIFVVFHLLFLFLTFVHFSHIFINGAPLDLSISTLFSRFEF
jgi:hypothetical protein